MERIHIAVIGPVNSGKSTLVNALCGQEVSLVSPVAGTTTDPVRKAVELPGLGACIIIDTPGLEDATVLGPERMRRTLSVLDEADIAIVLPPFPKIDADIPVVNYTPGESIESLLERIRKALPKEEERFLTGDLVKTGDKVLLVMPQDSEAPKGRIILPQVQVLRELLDRGCIPVCCTPESLPEAIKMAPDLVITDSQVFAAVNSAIPAGTPLTSFSVLLAGRVKIPALLRKRARVEVEIAAGNDFPENLEGYSLIIHCGACVAGRGLVQSRIKKALRKGVPITNYGIAIAALQGILGRIEIPGRGRE